MKPLMSSGARVNSRFIYRWHAMRASEPIDEQTVPAWPCNKYHLSHFGAHTGNAQMPHCKAPDTTGKPQTTLPIPTRVTDQLDGPGRLQVVLVWSQASFGLTQINATYAVLEQRLLIVAP